MLSGYWAPGVWFPSVTRAEQKDINCKSREEKNETLHNLIQFDLGDDIQPERICLSGPRHRKLYAPNIGRCLCSHLFCNQALLDADKGLYQFNIQEE